MACALGSIGPGATALLGTAGLLLLGVRQTDLEEALTARLDTAN